MANLKKTRRLAYRALTAAALTASPALAAPADPYEGATHAQQVKQVESALPDILYHTFQTVKNVGCLSLTQLEKMKSLEDKKVQPSVFVYAQGYKFDPKTGHFVTKGHSFDMTASMDGRFFKDKFGQYGESSLTCKYDWSNPAYQPSLVSAAVPYTKGITVETNFSDPQTGLFDNKTYQKMTSARVFGAVLPQNSDAGGGAIPLVQVDFDAKKMKVLGPGAINLVGGDSHEGQMVDAPLPRGLNQQRYTTSAPKVALKL